MCLALEADHVVAAVSLLRWRIARRTWCAEALHVIEGRLLFRIQLGLTAWIAASEFTMPAFLADGAESVITVFAD